MKNKVYTLEEASRLLDEGNIEHTYLSGKMLYVPKNAGIKCEDNTYTVYAEDNGRVSTLYSGFSEDKAVREVLKRCKIKVVNRKNSGDKR